ncbi:hypothetical protein A2630_02485 [Candidatus Woesebacteria bacterium RIFCSPHIGHO2_01_FULL_44_10]|uniref:Thymidylate kinase-like domain-containing protein n=1 Tax=Candidatus Woesebacteria bacterium RIFCSPLOWO2_01_FULL_44_14 TaxID=1802525 RepID=A0A1F8C3R1_9BACT|nr:MAG: hypothetical protein A2630_02485 [Candidatus Woesebacteria bacterium RIFCSPHIGHO2_01_FULL_44_10]OGM55641.1 MAG: hypothetical protein A3F62_02410 [Candidatus Woesebacteria bacterium RIFCSPHIGHO2_12_FULL_44_11]OGM70914.1 MAG: hypothetical protein A2975_01400 [Candidatus Woesebacteria bacterium RIFCSPLOWO2_01_FULL_44_14]
MPNEREGSFVVVEGSDSSGKEVQSSLLHRALEKQGCSVRFLDFPRYDHFFGSLVGRYLKGEFGEVFDVHPALASLPFSLDRFEMKDTIAEWLESGDIIISNRFIGSNLAHMSAKLPANEREGFVEWLEELEHERLGIPREDLAVFLHVPARVGQKLTYAKDEKVYMRGLGRGDIHERSLQYLELVVQQFLWLAKNRKQWVEITCMVDETDLRPVEDIHKDIMRIIKERAIIT